MLKTVDDYISETIAMSLYDIIIHLIIIYIYNTIQLQKLDFISEAGYYKHESVD